MNVHPDLLTREKEETVPSLSEYSRAHFCIAQTPGMRSPIPALTRGISRSGNHDGGLLSRSDEIDCCRPGGQSTRKNAQKQPFRDEPG
jgi:hypothetical protein